MNSYFIHYIINLFVLAIIYFPLTIFSSKKIYSYLNKKYNRAILYLLVAFFVFLPLSITLQQHFNTSFTTFLYYLAYIIIGTLIYFIIFTIIIEIIRLIFKPNKTKYRYLAYIIIVLTVIVSLYSYVNTLSYKEETIIIESKKIEQNIKFIQLSDIHIFGSHSVNRFNKVYEKAVKNNPDFIVITGDLFDYPGEIPKNTISIINDYNVPVIFVYGNHDVMVGEEKVNNILNQTKIISLNNEKHSIDGIELTGIKDKSTKTYLAEELNKIDINKEKYNILLNHKPQEVDVAQEKGYDLMLSGHTHAGQIFPLNFLEYLANPYLKGLYNLEELKLYVNQGTYIWGFKMRNLSRNEITIIELKKE